MVEDWDWMWVGGGWWEAEDVERVREGKNGDVVERDVICRAIARRREMW